MSRLRDDYLDFDEYTEADLFESNYSVINETFKRAIHANAIDELAQILDERIDSLGRKDMNALLVEAIICEKYETFLFLRKTFLSRANFKLSDPALILALLVRGSDEFIINLIETYDDVNQRDKHLRTPLHLAIQRETLKVGEFLIAKGANVDAKDCEGCTPLHYAVHASNMNAVCMLLYYEARPDEVSIFTKVTPFMTSLCTENHKIQEILLDYVVDFNRENVHGQNIFYLALKHRSLFCEEILKRGAKIGKNINLLFTDVHIFRMMWPMINRSVLSQQRFPLLKKLLGRRMPKEEILYYLETLLSWKHVDFLIEQYANAPSEFKFSLFADVCETLQNSQVELSQRLNILYLLLSLGAPVYKNDIYRLYKCFGYNEEFEALMIVNPGIIEDNLFQDSSTFLECICFNRMRTLKLFHFEKDSDLNYLLKLYIPYKKFKEEFYAFITKYAEIYGQLPHESYGQIIEAFDQNNIPSLLQLSRDSVRETIYSKNRSKAEILSFYSDIKSLPVPQVIKDILLLKKPLYNPFGKLPLRLHM